MNSSVSASSSAKNVNTDPYAYFQPGKVVYVLKHENDVLPAAQIQNLFSWSNGLADSLGLLVIPAKRPEAGGEQQVHKEPRDEEYQDKLNDQDDKDDQQEPKIPKDQEHRRHRVYSFSPKLELNLLPRRQIEPAQGVDYKSPKVQLPTPFTLISADVMDRNRPEAFVTNERLTSLVLRLDDHLRGLVENPIKPTLAAGVSLEVVSLNWLLSASSETGGTGGPGSRPVPFTYVPGQTATGEPDVLDFPFNVSQNFMALPELQSETSERGKGVKVAILDSAPSLHDLAAAYERWQKVNPERNRNVCNKLVNELLKPNGPLTVHPASYNDLLRMRSVHLHEHNYKMTDHGLFVASIIHNIAPAAEIHLYEVLNPDGVGDLERLERQAEAIKWLCDLLYSHGSRVIAAAGNDRRESGDRPNARYPAAFDSV